jgi:hypothetical protein
MLIEQIESALKLKKKKINFENKLFHSFELDWKKSRNN